MSVGGFGLYILEPSFTAHPASMTLEKVAKRAGVSTATVSRVMNNASVVRESTRERVLAAAKELDYHPNRHAQSLAGGRSRTLGIVVSNIENPFFLDILQAVESKAVENGYEIVYENTGYRPHRLVAAVRTMKTRPLAGLALVVSENSDEALQLLQGWDRPVVFYDFKDPIPAGVRIRVRYERAIQRTVEYLYSLGHRRMAFVGHHSRLSPLQERSRSFVKTVENYPDVRYATTTADDGPAGGRQGVSRLIESGFAPTAVLCINDYMAIGAMRELRDRGLRIPQDVSVTGFDNIALSEFIYPSLTTVNIPRKRIGRLIYDALTPDGESGLGPDEEILIEPELVVRESTTAARRGEVHSIASGRAKAT